jgi:hypothetical protein
LTVKVRKSGWIFKNHYLVPTEIFYPALQVQFLLTTVPSQYLLGDTDPKDV